MKKSQVQSQDVHPIFLQAVSLHQTGQLEQAKNLYLLVLHKEPKHFDALHLLGVIAAQTKNPKLAVTLISQALEIKADSAPAYSNLGNALKEIERLDDALASFDKALAIQPIYPEALNNRGNALEALQRFDEALASYDKAIAIYPQYAESLYNRGNVFKTLKRLEDALASYDQAIAILPDFYLALNNRGSVLQELKRTDEALHSFDRAIAINPSFAEAFFNRGNVLKELNLSSQSIESYERAISIKPDYFEAYNNLGNLLKDLKRLDDALSCFDMAIHIKPDFADAFNNRGHVLEELKRHADALSCYDQAIAIQADFAEAYINRGNVLKFLKRLEDALSSYQKANEIKPDCDFLLGTMMQVQMLLCEWSDLPEQLNTLKRSLVDGRKVATPFSVLGLLDNPAHQLLASQIYTKARYSSCPVMGDFAGRSTDSRIRIGYYSADFRNHVVSELIVEMLELHDPALFEVYCFSFGVQSHDEMRQRIVNASDHFIDVQMKSDMDIVHMSRHMGIDIAIDLGGYTQDSRSRIFEMRCAPIQVNYLGYPGTMGADFIDYIIADETMVPLESQQYFSEKIVYLPHCFQSNDSKREISSKQFKRVEFDLPEHGFVFCCFNNNYKILPETFDSWMRIIQAIDGSVLWLYVEQATAIQNLRHQAQRRGVNPDRLIFARRMNPDEHLARHQLADLFLDTQPFNAGATASTALWAGLPILTLVGNSFTSRYAASLLNAMDLPELITATQQDYESSAMELATHPLKLAQIKEKLLRNRRESPLFNGALFARHMGAAYLEMHKRHVSGEAPTHIFINP